MQWKSYTFLYNLFTAYLTAIYCSFTAYFSEIHFFAVKSLAKISSDFSDKYCKASIFHWNYENLLLTQPIIFLLFSLKLQYFSLKKWVFFSEKYWFYHLLDFRNFRILQWNYSICQWNAVFFSEKQYKFHILGNRHVSIFQWKRSIFQWKILHFSEMTVI